MTTKTRPTCYPPDWQYRPPSRLLRKLYAELETIDARLLEASARSYVPDHAPSDFVARREAMRPLEADRWRLLTRIDRAQNRGPDDPRCWKR